MGVLPEFHAEPRMPADAARMVVGCKPAIFDPVYLVWVCLDDAGLSAVDAASKQLAAGSFICAD